MCHLTTIRNTKAKVEMAFGNSASSTTVQVVKLKARQLALHASCGKQLIPNNPARFYRNTVS